MTMVLHTNSRNLKYHPHIHTVIPGGGVDRARRYWKKLNGNYLFKGRVLATVFRVRFLTAIQQAGLVVPKKIPDKWIVHCVSVGQGLGALKYLSQDLYRGVISEKNILSNQKGLVTLKYIDGSTGKTKVRTLQGEEFLHLVVQHVLLRGFKRVRDYAFFMAMPRKYSLSFSSFKKMRNVGSMK